MRACAYFARGRCADNLSSDGGDQDDGGDEVFMSLSDRVEVEIDLQRLTFRPRNLQVPQWRWRLQGGAGGLRQPMPATCALC